MSSPRARAAIMAMRCVVRGLPLLLRRTPGTPLRVLAIMALDTVHVARFRQHIPRARVNKLATVMDFFACANAEWDGKRPCGPKHEVMRRSLDQAGLTECMTQHLGRLGMLESGRPQVGGDRRRFDEVRGYREAVARLSLNTVASIALDRPIEDDADVNVLLQIVMQCQVIDDVLDYQDDRTAALPSFLTACASLNEALVLTRQTATSYGAYGIESRSKAAWPFLVALRTVSVLALLTLLTAKVLHALRSTNRRTLVTKKRRAFV